MVCRTSGKLWPAACSYMALKLKMVCPFTKHCGKESKGEKKKKEAKEYVAKTICSPQSLIYLLPVLYRKCSSMFFSTPVKS